MRLFNRILIISFIVIIVLTGYYLFTNNGSKNNFSLSNLQLKDAIVYDNEHKLKLPHFIGQNEEQQPFGSENLRGKISLLFFGFASCPDICPTELLNIKNMYDLIKTDNDKVINSKNKIDLPQIIFVTLDPKKDKPKYINSYLNFFDKDFKGIILQDVELQKLIKSLGILREFTFEVEGRNITVQEYKHIPKQIGNDYLINHSTRIYMVDENLNVIATFVQDHNPKNMYHDYIKIMQYIKSNKI